MYRTALRGIYGGSTHPKTKSQAIVSPVVNDMEVFDDGDLSRGEEGDGFGPRAHASLRRNSNNGIEHGAAVALKIHDVHEDSEYQLQRKSASVSGDVGMLSRLGMGQLFGGSSNQEQDAFVGAQAGQKYTVLGQKHQWRKHRASRSRQLQTISPVDDDARPVRVQGDTYSSGRGSANPSSTPSYYESRASRGPTSTASFREGTTSMQSDSFGRGSDLSQGRSHASSNESTGTVEDAERFVVTRQRKSTYSAKLHLHGQKPLYLGRYKNEAAALAACESAYSVISTPRK
ncbi:uncharacterized protein IUM83_13394 [Phytophthora cinnamomi]|uniref:uncharacterized protein n=1 Tax=Phytophthora cinnamomi TaxID=4785 RepID=UPI00355AC407|nr:hypothetical protein IUM83_13394 [Phytophthora cinnamomi]